MTNFAIIIRKLFTTWWGALFVFTLLNLAVYWHFLGHFFYSDDFVWIHHGELIRQDIMNVFRIKVTSFYSPVVNAYFYLGQVLFPSNHVAYHAVGLGIHILNTYLVFVLLKHLTKRIDASYVGAIFFAVAMYHYEAVIWISAIMHVLVTLFVLLGLIAYCRFLETDKKTYLFLSLLSGIVAFFTKENGIVFGGMIIGLYAYYRFQYKDKKSAMHLVYYVALLLGLFAYTYIQQRNSMWIGNGVYTISARAMYPLVSSMFAVFDHPFIMAIVSRPTLMARVCLGTLFLSYIAYKKWRHIFLLYVFGVFMMVAGFAPVMFFYFGTWFTVAQNRYSYLPTVGAAIIIAFVYMAIRSASKTKMVLALSTLVFLLYIGYNIRGNYKTYTREYRVIEEQMVGMSESFKKIESQVTPHQKIILVGGYPFKGNEYYRFLYRYMIDSTHQKSIEDWTSEINEKEALEKYAGNKDYLLLGWDNKEKAIYIRP